MGNILNTCRSSSYFPHWLVSLKSGVYLGYCFSLQFLTPAGWFTALETCGSLIKGKSWCPTAVCRNVSPSPLLKCSKGWKISAAGKCWAERHRWVHSHLWSRPDYWLGTQVDSWTLASPVQQRANPQLWRPGFCLVSSFTPNGLAKMSWTTNSACSAGKWGGD